MQREYTAYERANRPAERPARPLNPSAERMLAGAERARLDHERIMTTGSRQLVNASINAVATALVATDETGHCVICNGMDACNLGAHNDWRESVQTAYAWTLRRVHADEREDWTQTLTMRLLDLRPRTGKLLFGIARRLLGIWIFDGRSWASHTVSLDEPVGFDADGAVVDGADVQLAKIAYWQWHDALYAHGDTRRRPGGKNGALRIALSASEMDTLIAIDARGRVNSRLRGRGHSAGADKLTPAEKQRAYRLRAKARAIEARQMA